MMKGLVPWGDTRDSGEDSAGPRSQLSQVMPRGLWWDCSSGAGGFMISNPANRSRTRAATR